ncbi:unnamed protein product [Rhizoctonia solani]|uniref:tyrosinase n=1 Tax=Rhizoctonia solani TaxID=456999 RepID=A0A8H3HVS0_9AGAM|nr:unnamed protein product [Rhizoctonia solani]
MRDNEPMHFSLFVQSLAKIMLPGFQPTAASFHEIGGIHGMPYVPWLGDPDEGRQTIRGPWLGYCNHRSILFPTWHRPYLMVLEQIISDVAIGIAGEIAVSGVSTDESKDWMEAAEELRLPFWDWTAPSTGQSGFPDFLAASRIEILMPRHIMQSHENVLAYHRFNHSVDGFNNLYRRNRVFKSSGRSYYKEWDRTYRHPESRTVDVKENYEAINAHLTTKDEETPGTWANLTSDVAQLFGFDVSIPKELHANAWDRFSNRVFQSASGSPEDWRTVTSIEQPHDLVHVVLGGLGHMSDNDVAGFDPIFYLHHCNVDRILAFWEHIYPDYVAGNQGWLDKDGNRKPFTQPWGTWIQMDDQEVRDDSPLPPFRNSDYKYWTSNDTHSLIYDSEKLPANNKYYTYPPIEYQQDGKNYRVEINTDPSKVISPEERERQRAILQKHFGYNPQLDLEKFGLINQPLFTKACPYSTDIEDTGRVSVKDYRQFIIDVSLDPTLTGGSYILEVSAEVRGASRRLEVGKVAVLGRGTIESCGNCQGQRARGVRIRGLIIVPYRVVRAILSATHQDTPDTNEEQAVQTIVPSLHATLVLPDNTVHSRLQVQDEGAPGAEALSDSAAPDLQLWSCDVYQRSADGPEVPYYFHDLKHHYGLHELSDHHGMTQIVRQWIPA